MKNILFCADGTWNGPPADTSQSVVDTATDGCGGGGTPTNVVKVFANCSGQVTAETLTLQNEQEKALRDGNGNVVQAAKYIHGVGDSHNACARIAGGAFGMGTVARIVRGFTFISREYEPGDRICIAGFSRGAYTARALAGMIAGVGLLDMDVCRPEDKDEAYGYGIAAWQQWRTASLAGAGRLSALTNALLCVILNFSARKLPANGLIADVPIEAVAVWDTVGSLGIPVYAGGERLDVFRFTDTRLSDKVRHGFHAMAIDEIRADFPVTRWDSRTGIEQVWFVGAHADVGGGYALGESRLSDVGLAWMTEKLAAAGIAFDDPPGYVVNPLTLGETIHEPWENAPWDALRQIPRHAEPGDCIHVTVRDKWLREGYRPASLGEDIDDYRVVQ